MATGLAIALLGSWALNEATNSLATAQAEEPSSAADLYRPVRPAVAPRNVAETGYFLPLTKPPEIQAALDQIVEFDVREVPLDQLFPELQRVTGVPFVFDEYGFSESALTSDAEIDARSAGMPLALALDVLLSDLDLALIAKDDHVLITSSENADWIVETRLYAFADHPLLRGADRDWLADTIRQHAEHDDSHTPNYFSVLNGTVAVTATRPIQERAAAFLRQYARLLAEYDMTAGPTASWPPDDEMPVSPDDRALVVRATTRRDEEAYFRPLTRRPATEAFLDVPTDFDVDDKPMDEFFAELEVKLGVRFDLDDVGLEWEDTTRDAPLTFRAKGLTYNAALPLVVRRYGLAVVLQDDRVLVTSSDVERLPVETRRYEMVDHPLLRGEKAGRFVDELRAHLLVQEPNRQPSCEIRVEDGVLAIDAASRMLDSAEAFLRQYARLLARFDATGAAAKEPVDAVASPEAPPRHPFCFRCMLDRPWTEPALQKPAKIDVVDQPLEAILLDAERTTGVPFFLHSRTFFDEGIESETKLSFQSPPGATYAEALAHLLGDRNLTYVPRGRHIWVTSQRRAARETETRLYAIHDPPVLKEDGRPLYWQIHEHLEAADPKNVWEATIHLLPGTLVVTENPRKFALVEEFLAKHGLAPTAYAEKPGPPPGPVLSLSTPPLRGP